MLIINVKSLLFLLKHIVIFPFLFLFVEIKILTKSNVVVFLNPGLAVCCLIASSQGTGVSRKGCFISDAGNWERRWTCV